MPYIKEYERDMLYLNDGGSVSSGQLNYVITKACDEYLHRNGDTPTYFDYNEVIGVLECAKLELYRRIIAAYEDVKLLENGDVYTGGNTSGQGD